MLDEALPQSDSFYNVSLDSIGPDYSGVYYGFRRDYWDADTHKGTYFFSRVIEKYHQGCTEPSGEWCKNQLKNIYLKLLCHYKFPRPDYLSANYVLDEYNITGYVYLMSEIVKNKKLYNLLCSVFRTGGVYNELSTKEIHKLQDRIVILNTLGAKKLITSVELANLKLKAEKTKLAISICDEIIKQNIGKIVASQKYAIIKERELKKLSKRLDNIFGQIIAKNVYDDSVKYEMFLIYLEKMEHLLFPDEKLEAAYRADMNALIDSYYSELDNWSEKYNYEQIPYQRMAEINTKYANKAAILQAKYNIPESTDDRIKEFIVLLKNNIISKK